MPLAVFGLPRAIASFMRSLASPSPRGEVAGVKRDSCEAVRRCASISQCAACLDAGDNPDPNDAGGGLKILRERRPERPPSLPAVRSARASLPTPMALPRPRAARTGTSAVPPIYTTSEHRLLHAHRAAAALIHTCDRLDRVRAALFVADSRKALLDRGPVDAPGALI